MLKPDYPHYHELPDPALHLDTSISAWTHNRIQADANYLYRYDCYGRLTEKTDRIPAGTIRMLDKDNPHNLEQLIRLPGQQYDEETGLYYNRHRYYDPEPGRYITQDPIGLTGGWNLYAYPLNPVSGIDPLGLSMWNDAKSGACTDGICGILSSIIGPDKFDSIESAAYDALNKINSKSICEDREYAGLICKNNDGKYFSTEPNPRGRKTSYPFDSPCPNGTKKISAYHTHGADSHGEYWDEIFSENDKNFVKSKENNIESFYLGTPDGAFKAIDNKGQSITNRKGLSNVCRIHGSM